MLPAQVAEKLPAIELEVALVTCHRKLLQEPVDGFPGNTDVQMPPYEPPPAGGAGAGAAGAAGAVGSAPGAVGSRILLLLSMRAHAVRNGEAAVRVASRNRILFIVFSLMAQAIRKHDYKLGCARTELCVQHPDTNGNTRISATTL